MSDDFRLALRAAAARPSGGSLLVVGGFRSASLHVFWDVAEVEVAVPRVLEEAAPDLR